MIQSGCYSQTEGSGPEVSGSCSYHLWTVSLGLRHHFDFVLLLKFLKPIIRTGKVLQGTKESHWTQSGPSLVHSGPSLVPVLSSWLSDLMLFTSVRPRQMFSPLSLLRNVFKHTYY